jgi:hypothetical protein
LLTDLRSELRANSEDALADSLVLPSDAKVRRDLPREVITKIAACLDSPAPLVRFRAIKLLAFVKSRGDLNWQNVATRRIVGLRFAFLPAIPNRSLFGNSCDFPIPI